MTDDEARKIAELALNVDGGCPACVGRLLDDLAEAFPDHPWETLASEAEAARWAAIDEVRAANAKAVADD